RDADGDRARDGTRDLERRSRERARARAAVAVELRRDHVTALVREERAVAGLLVVDRPRIRAPGRLGEVCVEEGRGVARLGLADARADRVGEVHAEEVARAADFAVRVEHAERAGEDRRRQHRTGGEAARAAGGHLVEAAVLTGAAAVAAGLGALLELRLARDDASQRRAARRPP